MISLKRLEYEPADVIGDIDSFAQLLSDPKTEIGEKQLHDFFVARPRLILAMGDIFGPVMRPGAYQDEQTLFGGFRADFAVSNAEASRFLFVEFEDASADSIFQRKGQKSRETTNPSYEWSSRFEHGLSQVIDWHFRIDDYEKSSKLVETLGPDYAAFEGLLVVGRDEFVRQAGMTKRFEWRINKTVIDSRNIRCVTFDGLLREMQGRVKSYRVVA